MSNVIPFSLFTDFDIHLFQTGKHYRIYEKLGAHLITHQGEDGVYFAVWAPNAQRVSVVGDFNYWNDQVHPLNVRWDSSGIWEGFIPGVKEGSVYKYKIYANSDAQVLEKGGPFATAWEVPPKTGSVVWGLDYEWNDQAWMQNRSQVNRLDKPFSVYEVHIGSWRRKYDEDNRSLHYTEMAEELVGHVKELGFTHVELMPVMEHPFFGSWGYQVTGYFAPSSRFGTPQEFKYLIDAFHQAGIGVILDWVPSHFPGDGHGLVYFDGTHLYEHQDPRKGYHPDWNSYIFNYGRNEVRSFLISNALFWLDQYHTDGLRVDAVASMLYLDYSRKEGEWIPNQSGGRENLDAIEFLKEFNVAVYQNYPDVQTIAEESTAWPGVSKPVFMEGLGFGMKWMMGWMHDTLSFFSKEPIHRQYHQNSITFSLHYAFHENFMLPLSHDEVVYGKESIVGKMPGDEWQRFANIRLLYAYMFTHPGSNLIFMGGEFAQTSEWKHDTSLEWYLLDFPPHQGVQKLITDLNRLYRQEPALHELQFAEDGFEWIDYQDAQNSVLAYIRKGNNSEENLLVIANFTPVPRHNYRVGVPEGNTLREIFNSDDANYWGSGVGNREPVRREDMSSHGRPNSIAINLPPLGLVVLKSEPEI